MPRANDLEGKAAALLKRVQSQFSVGRFNGFIDHKGIQQTAFAYARAATDLRDLSIGNLRTFQREVIRLSEQAFRESIIWPEVSSTRSGFRYGEGGTRDRQTGRFTFGSGKTFVNVTSFDEQNNRYIVGWPDVERADSRTKGVWRHLEYGLAPHQHRLPRGFIFDKAGTGEFTPLRGPADRRGPGFEPKLFLQKGFNAADAKRLPKFQDVLDEAIKGLRKSGKGFTPRRFGRL